MKIDKIKKGIDNKNGLKYEEKIFRTEHGTIKHRIYEDKVVVFMGSYVDKQFRGGGIFKNMLISLLENFKDYDIYVPVSNDIVINLFLKLNFEIYDAPIRRWGKTENSINMYRKSLI